MKFYFENKTATRTFGNGDIHATVRNSRRAAR